MLSCIYFTRSFYHRYKNNSIPIFGAFLFAFPYHFYMPFKKLLPILAFEKWGGIIKTKRTTVGYEVGGELK
jgi:hypothetical protein